MITALELTHGIHLGVPEDVYHQRVLGLASKGALDLVRRSPAHYKAWVDGAKDNEESDALAFGKAFHCALLEPERFIGTYTVEPSFGDCRKKDNRAARDAWRAEHAGSVLLSSDDHLACMRMTESIRRHPIAGKLLAGGEAEVTARWRDEDTGIECKARADYLIRERRLIVDIKTAADASLESFRRSVANYGYHRQDAFYRAGFATAGAPVDNFVFVVVEKTAPYAVAVYMLDERAQAAGRLAVRDAIETLADCLERNEWAAYPEEIQVLELPGWAA